MVLFYSPRKRSPPTVSARERTGLSLDGVAAAAATIMTIAEDARARLLGPGNDWEGKKERRTISRVRKNAFE